VPAHLVINQKTLQGEDTARGLRKYRTCRTRGALAILAVMHVHWREL